MSIGIIDSGRAGLATLKFFAEKFPEQEIILLDDAAHFPYSNKSSDLAQMRTEKCIAALKNLGADPIIIANHAAASTNADKSIFNVIRSACAMAGEINSTSVGVLATPLTVSSQVYRQTLKEQNAETKVYEMPAPLLIPIVEEGWQDDPLTNLMAFRYMTPLMDSKIDSLIFGCSHFRLLAKALQKITGKEMPLIDPLENISEEILKLNLTASKNPGPRILSNDPTADKTTRALDQFALVDLKIETLDF